MSYSKKIVTAILIFLVFYSGLQMWLFYKFQSEMSVLTGAIFAFATGELWSLSKITVEKNKQPRTETSKKTKTRQPIRVEYYDDEVNK